MTNSAKQTGRRIWLGAVLAAALATACSTSDAKIVSYAVDVELASVTLADDCPVRRSSPPPQSTVAPHTERTRDASLGGRARACEQTSMQLAVTARSNANPTSIRIKRVELLDDDGKVLEVLSADSPHRWVERGAYAPWDEAVKPGDVIKASYSLNAPNWNKLTNGRMNAHTRTFQLRVVVVIGSGERTVEKAAITPARMQPKVVT